MAEVQNSAALLLVDSVGDKGGSLLTGVRKKKDQNVLRGSLLVSIPPKDAPTADGKPAYNYRVVGDDIMMYCSEYDVAPLTDYEFSLLSGIKSTRARYEAYVNDIMDWGSKVKVNDIVYVSLQAIERTKRCRAVVRWIGILPGEEGTKFGFEIFVSLSPLCVTRVLLTVCYCRRSSIGVLDPQMVYGVTSKCFFVTTTVDCLCLSISWQRGLISMQ